MSQHDKNIANASGAAVRADINDALEAEATRNSGSSYPGTMFPRQFIVNTTLGIGVRRNSSNSGVLLETTDDETRVLARSSNTMLDISDHTKLIVATGSFTQTFDTCANLTEWWHCWYRNDGTGSIVLDPSGSEQINGQATLTLGPGEGGILFCTGAALKFIGIARPTAMTVQVFTSSSTWTKPTGLRDVLVIVKGGGAAGAGSSAVANGGGGGEGETCYKRLAVGSLGATETVTIGAGSVAISANTNSASGAGGSTSFGALVGAVGGGGASSGDNGGQGGSGGTGGTPKDWAEAGAHGSAGGDNGGGTIGIHCFGGGKGGGGTAGAGVANSGGGGGGGTTLLPSGAGGSGYCIVIEYY